MADQQVAMFERIFSPTVCEVFDNQYQPQQLLDCSPKTLRVYKITLKFFDQFLGRKARLFDFTDDTLAKFSIWRLEQVARATVKRDLDCLLAIWRFCARRRLVKRFPELKPIYAPTPTPVALSREEIAEVWRVMNAATKEVLVSVSPRQTVPLNLWMPPMFLVCWDTAERIGPVFELQEMDVDLLKGWCTFRNRKGRREDLVKPLHADTCQAVRTLLDLYARRTRTSRVFRLASNHGLLWSLLGEIMVEAGLPDTREFKFHCFRKSSVSHFAAAGGDPVQHAGHSSDRITRKHYLDPRITSQGGAHELLFRPGQLG